MTHLASKKRGSRAGKIDPARLSVVLLLIVSAFSVNATATDSLAADGGVTPPTVVPTAEPRLPPDLAAQIRSLEMKLERQSAEVDQLRSALADEKTTARAREAELIPPPPPPPPPPPAPPTFRLSGFLQADYLSNESSTDQIDPSTSAPLNQNRFLVKRARLHLDIDHGIVAGVIEFDANTVNGPQARPMNMEASLRWPPVSGGPPLIMGTIGIFKIPYGFEIGQADTDRIFMERSNLEQAMFPGEYDLGARIKGEWRFLRYSLAVMNGNPIGEKTFPGIDPSAFKDFVGRIGIDTQPASRFLIRAGVSGDKGDGFHPGTPATKPTLVWHDLNNDGVVEASEITVIPGQDATPSQDFTRFAAGADLALAYDIPRAGLLTVYGEATYASNMDRAIFPADPVALGRNLREYGYYAAVTQDLFHYAAIGVRYDYYQPDMDAADNRATGVVPRDSSVSTLAMTAVAQYAFGRVLIEYDHNTNHFGRTLTGAPTTLPDDQVGVRGEVRF